MIRDEKGRVIGRVDLGSLDQLTLIEFDGLIKYAGRWERRAGAWRTS